MSDENPTGGGVELAVPGAHHEAVPIAAFDDPHLLPYAKHIKRTEKIIGLFLLLGLLGFAAYGGLYFVGGQARLEGVFGGVGLFAFGFGMSAWGKYLLPQGPFVEERHTLSSTEPEIQAIKAAVVDRTTLTFRRRGFLGGLLGAAAGVMGIVLAFPLIRSLAPNQPGKALDVTDWKAGLRLVDIDGRPLHQSDLEVGGALTVFPEGFVGSSVDQTMLVRAGPAGRNIVTKPGRETWGPSGYLAYSKMCTHAGCPVGLYQEQTQQLLCPCHQSVFDVLDGAQPVFGPAPRPLPQLPLMIDSRGWLRAQRGYVEPIGPGFWERS
ncbi:MAG TPA: Rieske 2Fe-2S domain-containing protein [Acidimicrobiales bacterium]|nr:Rieske 2Fe-2S domain-containing protein [Acidimicrobiales bacterium]